MTGQPPPGSRTPRRVRDRDVVVLMTAVVVAVLAANLLSATVPGLDRVLAGAPVLVLLLLAATAVVLARALRRPGR